MTACPPLCGGDRSDAANACSVVLGTPHNDFKISEAAWLSMYVRFSRSGGMEVPNMDKL